MARQANQQSSMARSSKPMFNYLTAITSRWERRSDCRAAYETSIRGQKPPLLTSALLRAVRHHGSLVLSSSWSDCEAFGDIAHRSYIPAPRSRYFCSLSYVYIFMDAVTVVSGL
jgi:hypothetical protein